MSRLRLGVIVVGIAMALASVRFDDRRLTWVTIGVLAVGLALRFAAPRTGSGSADADDRDASS